MSTLTEQHSAAARPAQVSTFAAWLRSMTEPITTDLKAAAHDDVDGDELLRRLREAGL